MGRPVFLNRINWDTNYKDCKMTLKLLNSFTKDPNAKQLCPQLVGNVLINQFSVTCVQKREVSLWIIFQVRMHVPAACVTNVTFPAKVLVISSNICYILNCHILFTLTF